MQFTDWSVQARMVYGPKQTVRKLAYCPQSHVLFVN